MNYKLSTDYRAMLNNAITAGVSYIDDNPGIKTLVMGISGGIDSAVTAIIARHICDICGDMKLIGQFMPIQGNKPDERERAIDVGKKYCHEFGITSLDDAFVSVAKVIDPDVIPQHNCIAPVEHGIGLPEKIRAGNIKARIRMMHLYGLAAKNNGLVLSTDNFTEYNLGFWTLHGDVGDFGLIQTLWKTEVYGVAKFIDCPAINACIEATPTDGLGVSDSDLAQILPGFEGDHMEGYRLVDDILIDFLDGQKVFAADHPVVKRHLATKFKRENPVSVQRDILLWRHFSRK